LVRALPAARDGPPRRRALHRQGEERARCRDRRRAGRSRSGADPLNAFFFGTSAFAVPILDALAAHASVTVVTQPDRPAGRGHKLAATPVKTAALERGLTVLTPANLRAFAAELRERAPDRCVVASYGRIIPQALLDAAPLWLNVHPSLLPLYRGATPIQSAIRDGRTTSAVSIIAMDAGMDTGDLLAQTPPVAIGERETYGSLHDRLATIAAATLVAALDADALGELTRTPQSVRAAELGIDADEIAQTLTRPWTKADATLPAEASARALVDRIRALAPKPGAHLPPLVARAAGSAPLPQLKILAAHAVANAPDVDASAAPPGTVAARHGLLFVRATDGWIAIDEVVPAGRGPMTIESFANGRRVDALYDAALVPS
jgi:methionyl-tRNA formyltransferase